MKKKIPVSLYIISAYFAIHGVFYLLSYFVATRFFIWEQQWNFAFGNPTLFNIHLLVPIVLGLIYIAVAYGLLRRVSYARVGLWLLCALAVFFEFPIGSIIGIVILAYSFSKTFSKQFPLVIRTVPYRAVGAMVIAFGIIGILLLTGVSSNLVSFTSHEIQGYEISTVDMTPESKIEGIEQQIGVLDVLIELTDPNLDYASEQQDILIEEIAHLINSVSRRFTVINAIEVNVEASNLLEIAGNENVKRITPVEPSAMLFPYVVAEAEIEATSSITAQLNADALLGAGRTGQGVIVAVMDTGIRKSLFLRDGVNIVIDSFSVSGQEYVSDHGTMVTSCVLDISPDVDILDVNVFKQDDFGLPTATTSDILHGFEYVTSYSQQTTRPIILSCSWGISPASWADAATVSLAVSTIATKYGIPVICSAGNSGGLAEVPYQIMSPSGAVSALSVGAVNINNVIASFSSRGPYYNGLLKPDVVANGVDILATGLNGRDVMVSGTSFSCPFVSGVAALLVQDKDLTPEQVYQILEQGASDLGATGYDTTYGYGLVNAEKSFFTSQSTPSEFDSTILLTAFVIIGIIIMAYPSLNKKLQKR